MESKIKGSSLIIINAILIKRIFLIALAHWKSEININVDTMEHGQKNQESFIELLSSNL